MIQVTVLGNLGGDPELRHLNGGDAVLNMRLAATHKVRRDGETVEQTEWFDATLWGKRAEALEPHLHKGDRIVVTGSLATREWQDREGRARTSLEIRISELGFAGGQDRQQGNGRGRQQSRPSGHSRAAW